MTDFPKCSQKRFDCFACMSDGRCYALDNTRFKGNKVCPFYKKEREVDSRLIFNKFKQEKHDAIHFR